MSEIKKGENTIVRRTVSVDLSTLTSLTVEIRQYNRLIASYDYFENTPDDEEVSEGSSTTEVAIQITEEVSAQFKEGPVYIKLISKRPHADYTVDSGQIEIEEEESFEVIL